MTWQQLTYATLAERPGRPGGWGVVEMTAGLSDEDREALLAGVPTRIDEVRPTDDFARREEIERRPRCLIYRPGDAGGIWWHAVPAGTDASGRPGNVFTHAVTTRTMTPGSRPVDLWRSPDWLAPFGAAEVDAARLGEFGALGPRGDLVAAVLARPDLVECLLSAVTWCFEEDRPLVLATESPEDFVTWLRAVCGLTSASVAARIPFTTFVRGTAVLERPARFEILGMPRNDLAGLLELDLAGKVLVLDLENPATRNGDDWEYAGQVWTAGDRWQDAFYVLSGEDPATIAEVLASMDTLTTAVRAEDQLSPAWPLALAVLRLVGAGHPDAEQIVADWRRLQPFDGLRDPVLVEILDEGGTATAAEPIAPEPDDADGEAFFALVGRIIAVPRDRGWVHLVDDVVNSRPALPPRRLPEAWERTRQAEVKLGMLTTVNPEVRNALQTWLRVAPVLAMEECVPQDDAFLARYTLLLLLGLVRVEVATAEHRDRCAVLLSQREMLPLNLVRALEKWQKGYDDAER